MPIHHLSQDRRHLVGLQVRTCDCQQARDGTQVVAPLSCRLLGGAHLFSQSERPVQALPDNLRRNDRGPQNTCVRHNE